MDAGTPARVPGAAIALPRGERVRRSGTPPCARTRLCTHWRVCGC